MFGLEGAWRPWMDQLTGLLSELDEGQQVRLGEPAAMTRPSGLLRQRRTTTPARYVRFVGGADVVTVECVGSTSFGGEWTMSRDTEKALERAGWSWPVPGSAPCFRRHGRHGEAMWLAESALSALALLGADPSTLQLGEATSRTVVGHQ